MAESSELFVGPRPYEEKDARFFFARDGEARDLVSLVIANPLLLIYASSGAGKTSLINARLVPMLGKVKEPELVELLGPGKGFDMMPIARVSGLVPAGMDLDATPGANIFVFNTLMSWRKKDAAAQTAAERQITEKQLAERRLPDFLDNSRPAEVELGDDELDEDSSPPLRIIIFDQFEELFTSHLERWDDREGFFEQVSDALEGGPVLLRRRDIRQPEALARRVSVAEDPVSQELRLRFSTKGQSMLDGFDGSSRASTRQLRVMTEELNAAIKGSSLYDASRFDGISLREETQELIQRKSETQELIQRKSRSKNFTALNRLLLEDAYPQEIYRRARGDRGLRIVFSMREDYIAELDPYTRLLPDRLGTRYRLERLRRQAALAAITRPMDYTHVRFADGVAEQLVENLLKTPIRVASGETES